MGSLNITGTQGFVLSLRCVFLTSESSSECYSCTNVLPTCVLCPCGHCPVSWHKHMLCKYLGNAALGLGCAYLGDSDRAETRLATVGEVTDDLYGV